MQQIEVVYWTYFSVVSFTQANGFKISFLLNFTDTAQYF